MKVIGTIIVGFFILIVVGILITHFGQEIITILIVALIIGAIFRFLNG